MAALIEHARSSILYERQLLRDLELLRTDVSNANKKTLPPANSVPKPAFIPKLEDPIDNLPQPPTSAPVTNGFQRANPPIPNPPHSALPSGSSAPQPPAKDYNAPLPPSPAGPAPPPAQHSDPLNTSATQPLTPAQPSPVAAPVSSGPLSPPLTTRTASTAPSTPQPQFPGAAMPEPPLGGRFADGTRSMFIQRSDALQTPAAPPLGGSISTSGVPPTKTSQPFDPLRSDTFSRSETSSPASSSALPGGAQAGNTSSGTFDPLGQIKTHQMASSVRIAPRKPKLDPREAASKLANMF